MLIPIRNKRFNKLLLKDLKRIKGKVLSKMKRPTHMRK